MLKPTRGNILIYPITASGSLSIPHERNLLRSGIVKATGEEIFHYSGEIVTSPVETGQEVIFYYQENQDWVDNQGEQCYLVPFNNIMGVENEQ